MGATEARPWIADLLCAVGTKRETLAGPKGGVFRWDSAIRLATIKPVQGEAAKPSLRHSRSTSADRDRQRRFPYARPR